MASTSSDLPPQLSDEEVNSILDNRSWQDDYAVDEPMENGGGGAASCSLLQEAQEGVEEEAVVSALEDMINGKSGTFASSSSALMMRVANGEDVVVEGSSGDATIALDMNKLMRWESNNKVYADIDDGSGCKNVDTTIEKMG